MEVIQNRASGCQEIRGVGARRRERAIGDGFGPAVLVWLVAFVGRLPAQSWSGPALLTAILLVLAGSGFVIGFWRRSTVDACSALLVTGLVNSLLVASVIHAGRSGEAARVDLAMWLWIPGNLMMSVAMGAVFGSLGRCVARGRAFGRGVPTSVSLQVQLGWTIVLTTLILVSLGGMVTTIEAGLAVPDWPTSWGYSMFLFPFTKMVGGIFYEHSHRLVGSLVGLETLVLCAWLWMARRREGADRRLAMVGTTALALVIIQGLLGAGRVLIARRGESDPALSFAVIHALTAQCFLLVMLYLIASLRCQQAVPAERENPPAEPVATGLLIADSSPARGLVRRLAQVGVGLIVVQTLLGALARHFHLDWAVLAHVLNAIAVSFVGLSLATLLLIHSDQRRTQVVGFAIMGVLAAQLVLGGTTWYITARLDAIDQTVLPMATLSVTSHVVLGSVLLGLTWWTVLHVGSGARRSSLEGAARQAGRVGAPVQGSST